MPRSDGSASARVSALLGSQQRVRPRQRLAAAALVGISFCASVPVASASAASWKKSLLALARDRIDDFYRDESHFDEPKRQDGVTFRLSKDDKVCAGDAVPLTFTEYDIPDVRPVDVFNVLADSLQQPAWDSSCKDMTSLGDFKSMQARGFAALFPAPPVASREGYEWQVVDANFTADEFWVVYSTLDNEELQQRKTLEPGAVQMENCLGAYKITKTDAGVNVINTNQINSHPWPLHVRDVDNLALSEMVSFAASLRAAGKKQAALGWVANRTSAPLWMLEDEACSSQLPDTTLKDSLLGRAFVEMSRPPGERGRQLLNQPMPGGKDLQLWRRDGVSCGGGGVPAVQVPFLQADFDIPGAAPIATFNALVDKSNEASWNKELKRAEMLNFSGSARGIHEELVVRKTMPSVVRELWEWQVAHHDLENGSYVVVVSSMSAASSSKFDSSNVEAHQCLAAFEISPNSMNGSRVLMISHLNPNAWWLTRIPKLWDAEDGVVNFAKALGEQASQWAQHGWRPDSDALRLLVPTPSDRNASLRIRDVLVADSKTWEQLFIGVDIPQVLDMSDGDWSGDSFHQRAKELHTLLLRLAFNATAAENATFQTGPARSPLEVQQQGQSLAHLQLRMIAAVAFADCSGGGEDLPDINDNGSEPGLPFWAVGVIAGLLLLVACATGIGGCCCVRRCLKLKRQRESPASLLLEASAEAGEAAQLDQPTR